MAASLPKTMKAAQLVAYSTKYEINIIPVPSVGENDVLIKIGAAGFCHTDYQVYEGVYKSPFPLIGSHEPVGTVVKVGPKAASKFKIGDRVGAILFQHQCHECMNCENLDDPRFCEKIELKGLKNDGGFAEYVVSDAEATVILPPSLSFEQAAPLMCAGATVWSGIMNTGVGHSEPIGIIGIGGLGSLGVQFAKALGHPVVAIDDRSEGKELAKELTLKADLVVDFADSEGVGKIKKWAGKGGLAAVVVCTDDRPAITWSLQTVRTRGVVVEIGLPTEPIGFDSFDLIFQEKTIKGSLVASRPQVEDMLKIIDKFGIRSHVTTIPLDRSPDLPELYMNPHLKGRLVVKMDD